MGQTLVKKVGEKRMVKPLASSQIRAARALLFQDRPHRNSPDCEAGHDPKHRKVDGQLHEEDDHNAIPRVALIEVE